MTENNNKRGILAGLIAAITMQGGAVLAQSGTASGGLEEIIVTAQRREQVITDVPISMLVVSDEDLARSKIYDLQGLATYSSSLTFDEGFGLKSQTFGLRGLGTSLSAAKAAQASVGIVIDGVPVARSQQFLRDLGDVERIEVLRGPQGTLYGKNSTAGVVNIVTQGPTKELDGFVEASATSDEEYLVRGAIGGPLTDRIRGRVFAAWRDQNPTIENINTSPLAHDMNGREVNSINGKLEVDFTDDISALFSGEYTKTWAEHAFQLMLVPMPGLERANFPVLPGEKHRMNQDGPNRTHVENWSGSADINWNLNEEWSLRSISSYSESDLGEASDLDWAKCGPADIGDPCMREQTRAGNANNLHFGDGNDRISSQLQHNSQEIQLHYNDAETSLIIGAFYEKVKENFLQHTNGFLADINDDLLPDQVRDQSRGPARVVNNTYSMFGDITRQLTDSISVFSGLRFTSEKIVAYVEGRNFNTNISTTGPLLHDLTYIRLTGVSAIIRNVVDTPTLIDTRLYTPAYAFTATKDLTNLSGRIGISWQPHEDRHFYLLYARGYKGPGVDMELGVNENTAITKEENADSIEGGFKGNIGDRLQLNVAAYWSKITDMQQATSVPFADPPANILRNIGDLRIYGVETDMVFRVTDQLSLFGSVTYTDTSMRSGLFNCYIGQTAAQGCNVPAGGTLMLQSLRGQPNTQAPEWKYLLEGRYNWSATDRLDGYAQLTWMWQDDFFFDGTYDPYQVSDSYGLLDFAVGVMSKTGRYTFEIFGKNVLDQWHAATIGATSIYNRQNFNATRNQDARYGVRTRVNFF